MYTINPAFIFFYVGIIEHGVPFDDLSFCFLLLLKILDLIACETKGGNKVTENQAKTNNLQKPAKKKLNTSSMYLCTMYTNKK